MTLANSLKIKKKTILVTENNIKGIYQVIRLKLINLWTLLSRTHNRSALLITWSSSNHRPRSTSSMLGRCSGLTINIGLINDFALFVTEAFFVLTGYTFRPASYHIHTLQLVQMTYLSSTELNFHHAR